MSTELIASQEFDLHQRKAKALSTSTLIPKEFQGNVSNCMIALDVADSLGMKPLMVLQNLYIVHGKPSWSSQFLIAAFNQCGKFSGITYTFFGEPGTDSYGCYAKAVDLRTGEILEGPPVTMTIAKKEGWLTKSGSKWQSMPDLMLRYRAATFFVRTTAPELTLGFPMADEVEDIQPVKSISIRDLAESKSDIFEVKPEQAGALETDERSSVQ